MREQRKDKFQDQEDMRAPKILVILENTTPLNILRQSQGFGTLNDRKGSINQPLMFPALAHITLKTIYQLLEIMYYPKMFLQATEHC